MAGYINRTGLYELEGYGVAHIAVRHDTGRISARWKGERLHVSAPVGISVDHLLEGLRSFGGRLMRIRPAQKYHIGQTWKFPLFIVTLAGQTIRQRSVIIDHDSNHNYTLGIHKDIDLSSPSGCDVVSRSISSVAQRYSRRLLERAREIARTVGKEPLDWEISRGRRTLGHCSTRGVIALSYVLLLYPAEMADAVVCHELAHLTEMNHSAAFHALCDSYCRAVTGQNEQVLFAAIKAYPRPVV